MYVSPAAQDEINALKAEIERLWAGIQEAIDESDKEIGDGDTIAEIFNELARLLADSPPQPREEAKPAETDCRTCLRTPSQVNGYCRVCDTEKY